MNVNDADLNLRDHWRKVAITGSSFKPDHLRIGFVRFGSYGDRCPAAYEGIFW
jgi:hypothetical protein